MPFKDAERAKEYKRIYYLTHKPQWRERGKTYYERNKKEIFRKRKVFWLENPIKKAIYDQYHRDYDKKNRKLEKTSKLYMHLTRLARRRAKKRNLPFSLTKKYVKTLIDTTIYCPLLGIKINYSAERKFTIDTPTLDRINPCLGYTNENVWLISMWANKIKSNLTPQELLVFAQKVMNESKKRNLIY